MNVTNLRYRRQFLISRETISELGQWNLFVLKKNLFLYSHPDLEITIKGSEQTRLVLIGYIFDPENQKNTNERILEDICERADSFCSLIEFVKRYTGQYVIIYTNKEKFKLFHDPLGLREVYYSTVHNRVICGSQPNILSAYSNPSLGPSRDLEMRVFYKYEIGKLRSGRMWIGDDTYYSSIKHLLPNHYLDVGKLRAERYWPSSPIMKIDLEQIVHKSCRFLQGALEAAAERYDLMMAVTGGADSRTLLAVSRPLSHNIHYFINKHSHLTATHPDIYIPKSIFRKIELPFHIHEYSQDVDPEFEREFRNNVFLSGNKNLAVIYNIYYKQHSSRLNILGVGEIGRAFFGSEPKRLDGFFLARSLKVKNSSYAVNKCQQWLDEALPAARRCNVSIMTLLLWEQLLGNWGAVGNSESDIAIEEYDPFNSHYLYELFLAIDKKELKKRQDIIFYKMINQMYPELLDFPINPPKHIKEYLALALKRICLFPLLKTALYELGRIQFLLKTSLDK